LDIFTQRRNTECQKTQKCHVTVLGQYKQDFGHNVSMHFVVLAAHRQCIVKIGFRYSHILFVNWLFVSVLMQEMSRSSAGKSCMVTDTYAGSETAARLADYSGSQYYYISGRPTAAAELPDSVMTDVASLSLPADNVDSGSEKDSTTSKEHKTENPSRDPAKVGAISLMYLMYLNVAFAYRDCRNVCVACVWY